MCSLHIHRDKTLFLKGLDSVCALPPQMKGVIINTCQALKTNEKEVLKVF